MLTPRYLAGSPGYGDVGFAPVAPPRPPVPTPRDLRPRLGVRPSIPIGSIPRWSTVTTPSAALPARPAARR
ncbi:hypothetical protein ACWGAN_37015 [Streptomyces sp. NPDC054945]